MTVPSTCKTSLAIEVLVNRLRSTRRFFIVRTVSLFTDG
jgi:hypothetical protein